MSSEHPCRHSSPCGEGLCHIVAASPLAIECRVKEAVRHASEVIERTVVGDIERADGLALLGIFGDLAYPRLDVNGIIGREKMKASRFAREMMSEGEVKNGRANAINLLRARFGETAVAQLEASVNNVNDLTLLNRIVVLAGTCSDPVEFRAGLPAEQTSSR